MPTCVGVCGSIHGSDLPVIRTCSPQNVRSAIMGKQPPASGADNVDRIILIFFLVLVHCATGCFGVSHPLLIVSKTLDNHPTRLRQFSDDEFLNNKPHSETFDVYQNNHAGISETRPDSNTFRGKYSNETRETNLKVLLENLESLQRRSSTDNFEGLTEIGNIKNSQISERYVLDNFQKLPYLSQLDYTPLFELLARPTSNTASALTRPQLSAPLDMLLISPQPFRQGLPKSPKPATETSRNIHFYVSTLRNLRSGKNGAPNYDIFGATKVKSRLEMVNNMAGGGNSAFLVKDLTVPPSYLVTPLNHLERYHSTGSLKSENVLGNKNIKSMSSKRNHNDEQFEDLRVGRRAERQRDPVNANEADSLAFLIFKTVKKMEYILKKGAYQNDDLYNFVESLTDSGSKTREAETFEGDNVGGITSTDTQPGLIFENNDENDSDKDMVNHHTMSQIQHEARDVTESVTADVLKAVMTRQVPQNRQFWRAVSAYLDSGDYLSRTRRSPQKVRKHRGHMHMSITFGHVMPCEYRDRFYCMNGGTCIFVGALDIKTCRCPIGYTGVRCELIDQEYIISLLTNTLIFS